MYINGVPDGQYAIDGAVCPDTHNQFIGLVGSAARLKICQSWYLAQSPITHFRNLYRQNAYGPLVQLRPKINAGQSCTVMLR